MARKLANLDICYQVVRHVTAPSVHALGVSLKEQLSSQGGGLKPCEVHACTPRLLRLDRRSL
eukprot:6653846-Prorocentrum_lima.AAC.1